MTQARTGEQPKLRVTPERLVSLSALLPWFVLGLLSVLLAPLTLLTGTMALAGGLYRYPAILGAFHLYVLGWGTSIALGALQQLAPVLFGTVLRNQRLTVLAFGVYALGIASLVFGLVGITRWPYLLPLGATLLPLGVISAGLNVWLTQRGGQATRQGETVRPFVSAALAYLGLAVGAGGALAVNLATGWLGASWQTLFPLHITWAVVGWFGLLVIGVSYHLLPFFGLVEKKVTPRWRNVVRRLLHGAILAVVLAIGASHAGWPGAPFIWYGAVGCLILACAGFLWDSRRLFARRDPSRMHPTVAYVRAAHVYLGFITLFLPALWTILAGNGTAYLVTGLLATGGWLSNTILGYLHRILPFFVWHSKYWGRAREPGIPAFRDMIPARAARIGFWLYNASVLLAVAGVVGVVPVGFGVALWAACTVWPVFVLLQTLWK